MGSGECLHRSTVGSTSVAPYVWLKADAQPRANSRCCFWSWPTGTCVDLSSLDMHHTREWSDARMHEDVCGLQHRIGEKP